VIKLNIELEPLFFVYSVAVAAPAPTVTVYDSVGLREAVPESNPPAPPPPPKGSEPAPPPATTR
jgi:hypothetical protein